jgi:hypothetical protein
VRAAAIAVSLGTGLVVAGFVVFLDDLAELFTGTARQRAG